MNKIVKEAISILGTNPYDAAHGVPHHNVVWNNVLWIIREEHLTVDREALEIAAWWHDVDKGTTHDPRLIEVLRLHDVPQNRIDSIMALMNQHSFGDVQTTLEGKVLFDADKLEYVSLARWKKFFMKLQQIPAKRETLETYKNNIHERVVPVYLRLNFNATKQRFALDYQEYRTWYLSEFQITLPPLPITSS